MTAAKTAATETKKTTTAKKTAAPTQKAAAPKKATTVSKNAPVAHGVGRRKAAVARVWLRRGGKGVITINKRPFEEYFNTIIARRAVEKPMKVVPLASSYDIDVNVYGGGLHGQADAVKLAISRALVQADADTRPLLKEHDLLTVDSRVVERKKPGQPGARRKFQFVKR